MTTIYSESYISFQSYNDISFFRGYVLIIFVERKQNLALHPLHVPPLLGNNFRYETGVISRINPVRNEPRTGKLARISRIDTPF